MKKENPIEEMILNSVKQNIEFFNDMIKSCWEKFEKETNQRKAEFYNMKALQYEASKGKFILENVDKVYKLYTQGKIKIN